MVDSHDAETYSAKDSRLIWIDCEMTGLDIFGGDELVEVSVVPTDFDLNVLDEGVDYVIKPSEKAVNHMNDFVRQMHTRSGLINEWENGLSLAEAEQKVTEYVLRFTPEGVRPLLAGNTIGSDKKFLDHYMPNLMSHLHYRSVDVSTFKELARRWYPAVYENRPPKNGGHRALADIIESLDELRYYRKAFMAPAPGPDDAASKAIAAECLKHGVHMMDAPVSGGEPKAVDGTLSIMCGGPKALFDKYHELLMTMGASAVHCGEVNGAGNTVKLANQIIVACNIAACAEAYSLSTMAGVDPEKVFEAIRGGLAGSTVMNAKVPMMMEGNFKPGFRIDLHIKDLNNALDTGHGLGTPMLLTAQVQEMLQWLHNNGDGQSDHSAILKYYERITGVEVRK